MDESLLQKGIGDPAYLHAVEEIGQAMVARKQDGKTLVIGVAGAQGSGKTTLAGILSDFLVSTTGMTSDVLSLDDFYLTKADRLAMADRVHPLFATRGVPGTHDLEMLVAVKERIASGHAAFAPRFNKAMDDREDGMRRMSAVDFLICEGWCWGAKPQREEDLAAPVNALEATRDPDGRWRREVNAVLASTLCQRAFASDLLLFLEVPDMEAVYRWRWQQEQALEGGPGVMDAGEVREFIMYYERITRHMLADMPKRVDFLVTLNQDHGLEKTTVKSVT